MADIKLGNYSFNEDVVKRYSTKDEFINAYKDKLFKGYSDGAKAVKLGEIWDKANPQPAEATPAKSKRQRGPTGSEGGE